MNSLEKPNSSDFNTQKLRVVNLSGFVKLKIGCTSA